MQTSQANDWATTDTATLLHSLLTTSDPVEATRGLREQLCRGIEMDKLCLFVKQNNTTFRYSSLLNDLCANLYFLIHITLKFQ